MAKKKAVSTNLELIGGIYVVEKFKDGTERREEIDAESVLKLIIASLEQYLDARKK